MKSEFEFVEFPAYFFGPEYDPEGDEHLMELVPCLNGYIRCVKHEPHPVIYGPLSVVIDRRVHPRFILALLQDAVAWLERRVDGVPLEDEVTWELW